MQLLTFNITKVVLFQKCRMGKSANSYNVLGKLIADIWSAEAVSYTGKSRVGCLVSLDNCFNPLGNSFVGECCMLPLPRLVIKVWI